MRLLQLQIAGFAINADAGLIDDNINTLHKELTYYHTLGVEFVEVLFIINGPNPMNLMNEDTRNMEWELFVSSLEFTAAISANIMVYHAGWIFT
jgi:hypothetical protein